MAKAVSVSERPSDYVRRQLRDEMTRVGISGRELCRRMAARTGEPWHESRLSKILNGRDDEVVFRVDDLILLCEEGGMSVVEVTRQQGREFVGDLTPSELKVIHLLREDPRRAASLIALLPERRASYRAQVRARHAAIKARMQRKD